MCIAMLCARYHLVAWQTHPCPAAGAARRGPGAARVCCAADAGLCYAAIPLGPAGDRPARCQRHPQVRSTAAHPGWRARLGCACAVQHSATCLASCPACTDCAHDDLASGRPPAHLQLLPKCWLHCSGRQASGAAEQRQAGAAAKEALGGGARRLLSWRGPDDDRGPAQPQLSQVRCAALSCARCADQRKPAGPSGREAADARCCSPLLGCVQGPRRDLLAAQHVLEEFETPVQQQARLDFMGLRVRLPWSWATTGGQAASLRSGRAPAQHALPPAASPAPG